MDDSQVKILIILFVFILITLVVVVFVLFYIFNKKRHNYINEKNTTQEKFIKELETSRIENQEHLLKMLSWELHDNIGQLLSVCKIQLSILRGPLIDEDRKNVNDTIGLLSKILDEVRSLSKSLNAETIVFMGLVKASILEVERLNRIGMFKSEIVFDGNVVPLNKDHEIILFRIIQEIISNVIKHSRGTLFQIKFSYLNNKLIIRCSDNGIGMENDPAKYGLGLKNILSRSKLINAKVVFEATTGGGLLINIIYLLTD